MFTTNQVAAAPVVVSREHMKKSPKKMRGIIVNSGNANCCSGPDGYAASVATAKRLAQELGEVDPTQVLVCSTGVIGAPLPVEKNSGIGAGAGSFARRWTKCRSSDSPARS